MKLWMYANPMSAEACALAASLRAALGKDAADSPREADVLAVLGGDGTVLRAVRAFYAEDKPFWAVNCGHLGYLTDCGGTEAHEALRRIRAADYRLEYRTHLAGTLYDGANDGRQITALNEMLFHRGACVHTLGISVHVNGSLALRYRGDGLLLCTPSGSTAYNLSAGGPVLMPEMELLVMTPICPQSLSAVPIVVSAHDEVRVSWRMTARDTQNEWPDLTADGQERLLLPLEGEMRIRPSMPRVAMVRTQDADFYGRLQHRMHWNAE